MILEIKMTWCCDCCTFENPIGLSKCKMCDIHRKVTPEESWNVWRFRNTPSVNTAATQAAMRLLARQRAAEDLLELENSELKAECNRYVDRLPKLSDIPDWHRVFRESPDMRIVHSILQCNMMQAGFSNEYRKNFSNLYKQLKN